MFDKKYLRKIRYNEDAKLLIPKDFTFVGFKPFRHQVVTLLYGLSYKDLAIFSMMGTGKTRSAIDIARYWKSVGEVDKVLVVCPSSVLGNWAKEVKKFSEYKAVILHHTNREVRKSLFTQEALFYIINYEATFRFMKQILKLSPDMIIYDESSRISNAQAKQTKACIEIGGHAKYRLLLNGTPIANKPLDLWSQMYCLDFGETLGSSFKNYRRAFFGSFELRTETGKRFRVYRIRNRAAMDSIAKQIAKKSIRYTKEECLKDLPQKLYQVRTLELPKSSRKLYEEMYANALLEVSKLGQNISARILLTKFIRALEITSGYLKTDEGNFLKLKTNPKLQELQSLIEEIVPDDAIVIWCKYLFSITIIENLLKKLGLNYLVIRGDVKDKSAVQDQFQESSIEEIPILIGQIRSGGIGLNLFKASYEIFYENEWRLLDRQQAEDRCHRHGSKKNVTVIDLLMKDTIDEQIVKAIKQKKDIADYIISKMGKET